MRTHRWLGRALVGGLILGLPAGALLFVQVPVLSVTDAKANRRLLAVQVRAGERFVLSYRHSMTRSLISETFEVEADGSLVVKETPFSPGEGSEMAGGVHGRARGERVAELSVMVHPFTDHTLVVKGQTLALSREVSPGALVNIRVERQFWWQRGVETWRRRFAGG